ncbi:MAG: hypothetical protein KAT79_04360 [candidate division Zixibacteria bacterium]|nr:hypothetical protein [candidate division Zixibacteria bacterium]
MIDEDFAERLAAVPPPKEVVEQLFSEARTKSEERFFCAIIDIETITHAGKSNLAWTINRPMIVQQFAKYFSRVAVSMQDFPNPEDASFVRRLHMLAYSQFWECLGVQRLLQQLANIAAGEHYTPRLFLDGRPETYALFKKLRGQTASLDLQLSELVTASYSNQIRNAFAHSQFWIAGEYVFFENHDGSKDYSIPSLKLDTWDKLFSITSEFIAEFFRARREAESELKGMAPYRVELPEFLGPFVFSKDDRGYWSAKPST